MQSSREICWFPHSEARCLIASSSFGKGRTLWSSTYSDTTHLCTALCRELACLLPRQQYFKNWFSCQRIHSSVRFLVSSISCSRFSSVPKPKRTVLCFPHWTHISVPPPLCCSEQWDSNMVNWIRSPLQLPLATARLVLELKQEEDESGTAAPPLIMARPCKIGLYWSRDWPRIKWKFKGKLKFTVKVLPEATFYKDRNEDTGVTDQWACLAPRNDTGHTRITAQACLSLACVSGPLGNSHYRQTTWIYFSNGSRKQTVAWRNQ